MKYKYDEIMEHIQLTESARKRILRNLEGTDFPAAKSRIRPFAPATKYMSAAACLVILLIGVLVLTKNNQSDPPEVLAPVNGIVDVSSVSELSDLVGFAVKDVAGLPFQPETQIYTSYWGELAQITFTGGSQTAVFRQSPGTEDNSGSYTNYPATVQVSADSVTAVLKGSAEGYTLAIWTDGIYSYSLELSRPLDEAGWIALIQGIR